MAGRRKDQLERTLRPRNNVLCVTSSQVTYVSASNVTAEDAGQKTFGLTAVPSAWTLPYFSISAQLHAEYRKTGSTAIDSWLPRINEALAAIGLVGEQRLLVRSSGCDEGIEVRGKLYTVDGTVSSVSDAIDRCLRELSSEQSDHVPLLVQKACVPVAARGHLSNERRCYEEARDWIGEIESADDQAARAFKINIRHWRQKILPDITTPLYCNISPRISETLKAPTEWALALGVRVHFEWVWDGAVLYIVQADEEIQNGGIDPEEQYRQMKYEPIAFTPSSLRLVKENDVNVQKFAKAQNSIAYLRLNLPTAPLYILDDQETISRLSKGDVSDEIRGDLAHLVQGSLVVRTDLATNELSKRQLLPRTQEVRNVDETIRWLSSQSSSLLDANVPAAFLFHNFIPSVASAFAYAAPGEPIVQIEGLWGLPEGLYYNSHDKFVVDTGQTDVKSPTLLAKAADRFSVRTKANYKHYYVAPDGEGKWQTFSLKPPFDWRPSLTESQCKYIAYHSRRIAEQEHRRVSIMWFVGVPERMAAEPMIPWYHEEFDPSRGQTSITSRTKTMFDRGFVVRTASDVEKLKSEGTGQAPLRRIRVQPQEDALLRDKSTLKQIGEAAKKHDAVIVLEGAVLSHAYYQLVQTGAIVEVVHPFDGFEERIVFNKLVRDKIPEIIKARKETAVTVALDTEAHIKALREKLVEEAYELLDASDLDSVTAELADVETVVRALGRLYGITSDRLEEEIALKQQERGSFEKGIVLLETENVLPTKKETKSGQLQLIGLEGDAPHLPVIGEEELIRRTSPIDKRLDRHVAPGSIELTASAEVSVTRRSWAIQTKNEFSPNGQPSAITGAVSAERIGSQWKVEVAVKIQEQPPDLFVPKSEGSQATT